MLASWDLLSTLFPCSLDWTSFLVLLLILFPLTMSSASLSGMILILSGSIDHKFLHFSPTQNLITFQLNPFNDTQIQISELLLLRESSIRVLLVCTIFSKHVVAAGLCHTDIGY
ncbi:hypothetical protein HN51_036204 [Arachis hypogaea]